MRSDAADETAVDAVAAAEPETPPSPRDTAATSLTAPAVVVAAAAPASPTDTHQLTRTAEPDEAVPTYVILLAMCAALNSCNLGYDIGVNSGVGFHLQAKGEGMELSDVRLELFFGIFGLAAMVGAAISYTASDGLGRRKAFACTSVAFIIGVLWTATATSYASLLCGRFVTGSGVGLGLAIDPVYIAEVSPPQHRGRLVTWSETATNVGILLGFISGFAFRDSGEGGWRAMIALGAVIPCVLLVLIKTFMPESPRWLVAKGRSEEARLILRRCYPPSANTDDVINQIQAAIEEERRASNAYGWSALLIRPTKTTKRMLIVGVGIAASQQLTAIEAIQYYILYILADAGVKTRSQQFAILLCIGVIKVLVIVVAGRLFDHPRLGRKPLLTLSNAGCAGCLVLLALATATNSAPLAILALALYVTFFSLGAGPGIWLVASEVFSLGIRGKAMSLATTANRALATVIGATFLSLKNVLGDVGFLLFFALLCCGNVLFIRCYVPETKGKSLEEMLLYFEELSGESRKAIELVPTPGVPRAESALV